MFGLTPPEYWYAHHRESQEEAWNVYKSMTKKWKNPDLLVANGDLIDGKQKKSGGAELTTADRNVQCDMATTCLRMWNAKKVLMTYGSAYHTGDGEDFEYTVAQRLKASVEGRLYFEIEGITFDVRHKIGTSGIPHGRGTAILKEMMWSLVKESLGLSPKIDVIVRSHAHYHIWIEQPKRTMFITPSLQLSRGRYGSRECTGETHWGMIKLDVHNGQIVNKEVVCIQLAGNKPNIIKIK